MSVDTLVTRIVESDKFQRNYRRLLIQSVSSQIPNIQCTDSVDMKIEWGYLLSCASLMVQSKEGKMLDIVYRICQTTISAELPQEYKNVAAMLFDRLSNSSAVQLSKSRNFIQDNYLDEIPFGAVIDVKQNQFANTIIDGENSIVLNPFQKEVYTAFENNQTITISAPTSAGKSFILLHLLSDYIRQNSVAKIIYIVPTRALIQQVELDIREQFKRVSLNVEVSSVPVLPDDYENRACTFIFTQERLQWVLNENSNLCFDLIIVDEAHKIGDRARGILLQQVLQQVSYKNVTKFIFASPMAENPKELFKVVKPESNQKEIISEIVTVNQNLIWVSKAGSSTTKWNIDLFSHGEKIFLGILNTERIASVTHRLPVLAYRIAAGQKGNLLYVNGAAEAEKVAIQLRSLIMQNDSGFLPSLRVSDLIKLIRKTIHPNYALIETLKAGVAFHYGNMPLAIRSEIEELFKIGDISFLVCTSTLVEGVNLPAKSIFIRGPKKGKNVPMDEMDFWNLAGRAGRQGKEFQGNIYCLDAGDNTVWKNGTPNERKKYKIRSTIDMILDTRVDELLSYIESMQIGSQAKSEMDYAYTYFLEVYYKCGNVANSYLSDAYGMDLCNRIDQAFEKSLQNIEVPSTILTKNQGINPIAQQKLLEYFISFDKGDNELIPPYPEDDDAQEKYTRIIGRISSKLTNDPYQLNSYRAVLVTNWMRGHSLARIISDNIKWHEKNKSNKNIAAIIRETMRDIEEYARFRFLKYTTCYIDILKFYLGGKGNHEAVEKIPQLNLWLEFGASKTTQISLMAMGFTRTAALEFAELMVDENYDKSKCLWWFSNNDIYSMDLPKGVVVEAERILALQ